MRDSVKLLRECENGGQTALDWIAQAGEETESAQLKRVLEGYQGKYSRYCNRLEQEFSIRRKRSKKLSPTTKAGVWMKLHTGLLLRHTDSEIADMISDAFFQDSKRLSRAINQLPKAEQNSVTLAKEFIFLQQKFTEELREFL